MIDHPEKKVDVILDTDTYNESDDQFALSYLISYGDRLNLVAVNAAPFQNRRAETPAVGMELSYKEILKLLSLMGREDLFCKAVRGSETYLPDENTYVESDACERIIAAAKEHTKDDPLYVVAIGAITNVASALIKEPSIKDSIVVVWLGGNAHDYPDAVEFNLTQDIAAGRVVFGCGVPVVQLPCLGVVSEFRTSQYELEHWLAGKNRLCDYLLKSIVEESEELWGKDKAWSRVIWDVTSVAWLVNDGNRFVLTRETPAPVPEYDRTLSLDTGRKIECAYHINRDALYEDLFRKLAVLC